MSSLNNQDQKKAKKLVDRFFDDASFDVDALSYDDFKGLLSGLSRVFVARCMNCVDPSGKKDKEWRHLSAIMSRTLKTLEEKESVQ